ncbi:MAG: peptide-methionine (S)-S-oxide reductase MsrA [Chloroflexota bacterium]|nr:peptide-methionine (S)-S-oxide reductase MsrA [Chloroflexota bacterium]MED5568086.1 peptide-methionine (S)-S-oxide reductase MsrA [Chloroflexota bacterium]
MADKHEIAVFAGGCFWCTEAVFAQLKGVLMVVPGYAGGHTANPTYREVCTDSTGHSEAIRIQFDPDQVNYKRLLNVFFETHDPTTLNRQGADRGTHYRSMVLYADDNQKEQAEAYIKGLDASGSLKDPVVTEVVPLDTFYEAEGDHHQFYLNNPDQMYCQIVIKPKVDKVRGAFAEHLR